MPKLKIVDKLEIAHANQKNTTELVPFVHRYPTKRDADHGGYVFAYKPAGWPEVLQPQYPNAPAHVLAKEGYWSQVTVEYLQQLTYSHPDWRKRLHYTYWKPISLDHEGYLFDPCFDRHPETPEGLDWDTYDWSYISDLVDQARVLINQQYQADRQEITDLHSKLTKALEPDDTFYLNQWLYFVRRVRSYDWSSSS
jgi:hypothetical protein